jgi:flagellar biogenesis protein FliO
MVVISALRETEAWSATSVVLGLLLLALVIGFIVWRVRRFMQGP